MNQITYTVPDLSCDHCERAVKSELAEVPGATGVTVELQSKQVDVRGEQLDDIALRAAIVAAGYEAT